MKKSFIYTIVLFTFIFTSCLIYRNSPPQEFTYKYDGKYTGIDTLINVDGYFKLEEGKHTNYIGIMFFRDGLVRTLFDAPIPGKYKDEGMLSWGRYIIHNDTIFTQIIIDGGGASGKLELAKQQFKILSKDEILLIGKIPPFIETNKPIYKFIPLDNRIDSASCWLLKKKWFYQK